MFADMSTLELDIISHISIRLYDKLNEMILILKLQIFPTLAAI